MARAGDGLPPGEGFFPSRGAGVGGLKSAMTHYILQFVRVSPLEDAIVSKLPTDAEAKILTLLISKREMYGLEIAAAGIGVSRNGVYVQLGRMIDRGFVTARKDTAANLPGPPRVLYSITGEGQRALAAYNAVPSIMSGVMPGWAT